MNFEIFLLSLNMVQVYCIEHFKYLDLIDIQPGSICDAVVVNQYYLRIEKYPFYLGDYPKFIERGVHQDGFSGSVDFYKYFRYLSDVRDEIIDSYLE